MRTGLVAISGSLLLVAGGAWPTDITQGEALSDWVTVSANIDAGYRKTQFFEEKHDSAVVQGDSRLELWLPPSRGDFSWGPYVRLAGITSSSSQTWENAWLSAPGFGFQIYPFSSCDFAKANPTASEWLGPLRVFAEYNVMDYWGEENSWRPNRQTRAGAEYWKALNVNDTGQAAWAEIWSGLWWQSANEFDDKYDTVIFAGSIRSGLRVPDAGIVSAFTPYALIESSSTANRQYYWENRLSVGGGLRIAPSLRGFLPEWDSRIVIYAEYVYAATYYGDKAPSNVPDDDFRAGIGMSFGPWYR